MKTLQEIRDAVVEKNPNYQFVFKVEYVADENYEFFSCMIRVHSGTSHTKDPYVFESNDGISHTKSLSSFKEVTELAMKEFQEEFGIDCGMWYNIEV